jgi:translin
MQEGVVLLEKILKRAVEDLKAREEARHEVLTLARRMRMRSKQAIMMMHVGDHEGAEVRLVEAKGSLEGFRLFAENFAELIEMSEVKAAWEEYAEASILLELKALGGFPAPDAIAVPLNAYILGLGDVVGELRREALDLLRVGDVEAAAASLRRMEQIYSSLMSVEEASVLLKGLRRKLDIARGVIERTRGELTAEAGRRRLTEHIRQMMDRLAKGGSSE